MKQFEDLEEERTVDPIAGLLEVLANINTEEIVMVEMLSRPAPPALWPMKVKKEAEKFLAWIQALDGLKDSYISAEYFVNK